MNACKFVVLDAKKSSQAEEEAATLFLVLYFLRRLGGGGEVEHPERGAPRLQWADVTF